MQTFIPTYRENEEQAQKYLQELNTMIQEAQGYNIRDPSKSGRIVRHYSRSFLRHNRTNTQLSLLI